jgi:hypothetical protein
MKKLSVKEVEGAGLLDWIRKVAAKMYPQIVKDSYSQYEVRMLLIEVGKEHLKLLAQAREDERERIDDLLRKGLYVVRPLASAKGDK